MIIPPTVKEIKLEIISKIPFEVPFKIFTEMMIKIIQVASFIKDSPSIKDLNF